ncbi:venom peptide isomerase heavy chain [Folsomia candida]|uniref:venom peptide isomerase heavy chain n=1 Tax=Folsomia candida TaxID=158441 RepID=UPI000B909C81|nr:venom peptide isomerase heavy chain [Folsomia candida]
MKRFWKLGGVLFLGFLTLSTCTVWNAEDALILEVESIVNNQSSSSNSGEVVTTLSPESGSDTDCVTNEGVAGTCIRFTECYPYFQSEIKDVKHSTVSSHIEVVRNMSTPCQPAEVTTNPLSPGGEGVSNDDHICCATLTRAASSGNLPSFEGRETTENAEMSPQEMEKEKVEAYAGCGLTPYNNELPKVVQGREAKKNEFPWAVALFQNGRHHCGASLIDARHVVTAAHCVNNIRTGPMLQNVRLYIGAHDIYGGKDYEVRKVKKLAFHKGFNGQQFRDDIALMVLDSPVMFSESIKPVCLYSGSPPVDGGETNADIAGWGKISEHGPPSRKLRTASIRIWTNSQCAQKYVGTLAPTISSGMVCAGSNGKDSCQGDSGGSLTLSQNGRQQLIGVVSWGIKCGVYPGVYTRLDKYVNWIEKYKVKLNY